MGLGGSTAEIATNLSKAFGQAPENELELLAPPAISDEIITFFDTPEDVVLQTIQGFMSIKSPATSELSLPASIFESLIDDYRQRAFRGMKVAEEEIANTEQLFMGKEVLSHKEFQMASGKLISKLRERFRTATRTGTIDSKADFDLIMLAREQDGYLVTTDEGVLEWARLIGVREMSSSVFGKTMQAYL